MIVLWVRVDNEIWLEDLGYIRKAEPISLTNRLDIAWEGTQGSLQGARNVPYLDVGGSNTEYSSPFLYAVSLSEVSPHPSLLL